MSRDKLSLRIDGEFERFVDNRYLTGLSLVDALEPGDLFVGYMSATVTEDNYYRDVLTYLIIPGFTIDTFSNIHVILQYSQYVKSLCPVLVTDVNDTLVEMVIDNRHAKLYLFNAAHVNDWLRRYIVVDRKLLQSKDV